MATVERRVRNGRVTWRVRYWGPDGRQRSKSFTRAVDAQRYRAEVDVTLDRGTWVDPASGRIRYIDWLEEWWPTTVNLRPSTRVRDETYLKRYVVPWFGELPLAAITQLDVRAWVADLTARKLAPATVGKAYQLLGKTLSAAVDDARIGQSPCRKVDLPRIERQEMRFLDPAQLSALSKAMPDPYRCLVLLGGYGGLRIGELAGLRRHRVDLLRGTVTVAEILVEVRGQLVSGPPKTRAGRRTVGLPRPVLRELDAHMRDVHSAESYVFTAPQGGPLRVPQFRQRVWAPAVRKAGLIPLRPHDLRHTAVALWIAAGANPKEVAARAGHTSVAFTLDRYGHLYPESDQALRERLEAMFERGSASDATARVVNLPGR